MCDQPSALLHRPPQENLPPACSDLHAQLLQTSFWRVLDASVANVVRDPGSASDRYARQLQHHRARCRDGEGATDNARG